MSHFVEFKKVSKIYTMGEVKINALSEADFYIEKGEICVIVGPSGAGKTTLLNILGGMDTLTSGNVFIDGEDISAYPKRRLTAYRRYDVGFVFQFYNLIQNLTALENVELATQICRDPLDPMTMIEKVGRQKFSGAAFGRRAAEGVDSEGARQESEAAAVRRTYRSTRLCYR